VQGAEQYDGATEIRHPGERGPVPEKMSSIRG